MCNDPGGVTKIATALNRMSTSPNSSPVSVPCGNLSWTVGNLGCSFEASGPCSMYAGGVELVVDETGTQSEVCT